VDTLSTTLVALSDPTRRAILSRLAQGPASVNKLAHPFKISQQAISKHLACLERAHLIEKRRKGRQNICALNLAPFGEITDWIGRCRQFWDESFDRLDVVLDEMKMEKKNARKRT
jgi:DNA-binding transcriptional ArsR family regulator